MATVTQMPRAMAVSLDRQTRTKIEEIIRIFNAYDAAKQDIVSSATEDNLAAFDASGQVKDAGIALANVLEPADVAGTANRVTVTNNGDGTLTITLPDTISIVGALLSGLTATRLLATDGSKNLASTSASSWIAGGEGITITDDGDGTATIAVKQQGLIPDATDSHSITDPADSPADADALRDDLVANALPEIVAALDALGAKINTILDALIAAEIIAEDPGKYSAEDYFATDHFAEDYFG